MHQFLYHMVAAEGLHDWRLVQELDPLPQAGWLVHRFHRHVCFPLALHDVLSDALVDHAEGALAQLPQDGDLLTRHLPLVLLVHCKHISGFTAFSFRGIQEGRLEQAGPEHLPSFYEHN